jgi:hypothetical protein
MRRFCFWRLPPLCTCIRIRACVASTFDTTTTTETETTAGTGWG